MSKAFGDFDTLADEVLEHLFEVVDDGVGDVIDVDFDNSILTMDLPDGRQYIVNKHAPNQEIWLSSPLSGAAHFVYDAGHGQWRSTRDDTRLMVILADELKQITGVELILEEKPVQS